MCGEGSKLFNIIFEILFTVLKKNQLCAYMCTDDAPRGNLWKLEDNIWNISFYSVGPVTRTLAVPV